VALTLVHTADWHLGMRFRQFEREDAMKLSRARLEVIDRILGQAEQNRADAVLCAGDLFDEAKPNEDWWMGLAKTLSNSRFSRRPIFLLPGNHDPIVPGSLWEPAHPFRRMLPAHVHVVDHDDFTFVLKDEAVLHAAPCRSYSTQKDLALSLPARAPGDERIRIGMVHGSTFDMKDCQTNFPIAKDAVTQRGFDYLAIGDTHGFRVVPPDAQVPTVYPGAPEPTSFGEKDPGHVALVFINRRRMVRLERVRVAQWDWETRTVRNMTELRKLRDRGDLVYRVLQLKVKMSVSAEQYDEAEQILCQLKGTEAVHGRVGILLLERQLELDMQNIEELFASLPETLQIAARRLQVAEKGSDAEVARRALYHLYQLGKAETTKRGA